MTSKSKAVNPGVAARKGSAASVHPDKNEVHLKHKDNLFMVRNQLGITLGNSSAWQGSREWQS